MSTEVVEALTRLAASPMLQQVDAEPLSKLIKLAEAEPEGALLHQLDKLLERCTPLERFMHLEVTGSPHVEDYPGQGFEFCTDYDADDAALAVAGSYDVWFGDIRIMWDAPRYASEQARIEATPEYQHQQEETLAALLTDLQRLRDAGEGIFKRPQLRIVS